MDFIPSSIFRGQLSSVSNIPQKSVKLLTSPRFPKKNETKSMSQELEWRRAAKDFSCQEFTFIKTERWPRRELIKASQKTMLWLVLYMKKKTPKVLHLLLILFWPFCWLLEILFFSVFPFSALIEFFCSIILHQLVVAGKHYNFLYQRRMKDWHMKSFSSPWRKNNENWIKAKIDKKPEPNVQITFSFICWFLCTKIYYC